MKLSVLLFILLPQLALAARTLTNIRERLEALVQTGEGGAGDKDTPINTDRISCVRQDDLDLVKPLEPRHSFRMGIPTSSTTTKNDLYVSVDNLLLKSVSINLKLTRTTNTTFTVDIYGDEECCNGQHHNLAGINFWLNGTDIIIRNSWLDLAGDWAANRALLAAGQNGSLRMKLHGEGLGVMNPETGNWEVSLVKKETTPFHLNIDKQWILEKALNSFGGLDTIIMDNVWSLVAKLIPTSYTAALKELAPDELWTTLTASITGKQAAVGQPLMLTVKTKVELDTIPSRLLQVLVENFDAPAVAEQQLEALLNAQDIKELWESNKAMLNATLRRYGVNPDFLEEELDLVKLRERLIEASKVGADVLVKGLRPFMRAQERGHVDPFEGFGMASQASLGWDKNIESGRMSITLAAPSAGPDGARPLLDLPRGFLVAVGDSLGAASDIVVAPPKGAVDATMGHTGMSLKDATLECNRIHVQNFRMKTGGTNGTAAQIWKLGGAVKDIVIKIPKSFDPGWTVSWDTSKLKLSDAGHITVDYGTGVSFKQSPYKEPAKKHEAEVAKPRKGDIWSLEGPIPKEFARPVEPAPGYDIKAMAPLLAVVGGVEVDGKDSKLKIVVTGTGQVTLNVGTILRPMLATRPQQDFGYIFFHTTVKRFVEDGEKGVPPESEMVAVVSCGYLRLIAPGNFNDVKNPSKIIDFTPTNGQLEIDLGDYHERPTSYEYNPEEKCMNIYSSGLPPREWSTGYLGFGTTYVVKETLCANQHQMNGLLGAIGMQVQRFRADWDKTRRWSFGSHPMLDEDGKPNPQYLLAPDKQTKELADILGLGGT